MEAFLSDPVVRVHLSALIGCVVSAVIDELIRRSALSSNSMIQLAGRILRGSRKR